ncbi:MAG TPA: glycosyltransferase [Candidatus Acidoferrales bacterium]|jgi:1,2-diacylglycerol 3-beta-galactosyltransferase|nr:glycosyltransferase [Candidatus Acidoferrales bacterium]
MKRIAIVFHDAGGGHRNAANALAAVIESQKRPWEITLVNLQDQLDSLDVLRRLTGVRIQEMYNRILRNGWTLGTAQLLKVLQAVIALYNKSTVRRLEVQWRSIQPDTLVSVIPHFNRELGESYANVFPGRPFVTILTDFADYPPRFWIEPRIQRLICGTERAVKQARAFGYTDERIFPTSGMILNPRFYETLELDAAAERMKLGLRPGVPTGVVLFGGYGSKVMVEIAERLSRSSLDVQLIMICGKNDALAAKLRGRKWRMPVFVEGFTARVNEYMQISDFFMGKPGPGSISEAVAMALPVIVECNAWTLPQERYNTEWVREREVGIVVHSFRDVVGAVNELLSPGTLARMRSNAAAIKNRAVFEIPDILEKILNSPESAAS